MSRDPIDFGPLEKRWRERARRVAAVLRRAEPGGMTRPPRDPAEAAWLEARGAPGPFVEQERKPTVGPDRR